MKKIISLIVSSIIGLSTTVGVYANPDTVIVQNTDSTIESTIESVDYTPENTDSTDNIDNTDSIEDTIENTDSIIEDTDSIVQNPDSIIENTEDTLDSTAEKEILRATMRTQPIYSRTDLPSRIDNSTSQYMPPIGLQTNDDCSAWAAVHYMGTYQMAKAKGWNPSSGDPSQILSPSFAFNLYNKGQNKGVTLSSMAFQMKNVGAVTLSDFPYIPNDYTTQPSEYVKELASKNKITSFGHMQEPSKPDGKWLDAAREHLSNGDIFTASFYIGRNWDNKWYGANKHENGLTLFDNNWGESYSSHAVTIVGYDDTMPTATGYGAFKIANSWSSDWGDNGYAYISYESYLEKVNGTCKIGVDPVIEEEPPVDIPTEEVYHQIDNSQYYDIGRGVTQEVDKYKIWYVKFNMSIDENTLQDNIQIYKQTTKGLSKFPVIVVRDYVDSAKALVVTEQGEYTPGTYFLYITQQVKSSTDSKPLKQQVMKTFEVK